ncbi:hypothetical protein LEP1GSC191_0110 [Leptospira borgpetersenii serovar Mini str. 201000851]|uniref:Lipoprotein n=1 Tax=Leptospira borgpetersenii str. 200801926 TaxID=1193009 RepID=A0ABN0HUS7_LEPBO|nr:hypothetical protein LEP1GSC128_0813 [Leptospira borgpetersenii str. 200801926]EKQ93639.1 hypothetical protein LEP1GSC101_0368 [Leptospira borgpetersenii str. UI 09149]EKQ98707.1 hypothetical protein LEP1GSC121_0072 [Leptospira borgpetersenii serovar Castellonis str. 200801910]ENO62424.1 hypothetical protein LEP1GSC191_0110 [Leptospira borgpetersenii serovar Mini str. 201000851]
MTRRISVFVCGESFTVALGVRAAPQSKIIGQKSIIKTECMKVRIIVYLNLVFSGK